MNMLKVSIIVPVYGVEKYIERCARSLFEQTYENLEYIFVDDCTKDDSVEVLLKVLDDYPNRKSRVTILHHEHNKGLPQARKTGMLAANGEYIVNVDSDDWVDHSMVDKLVERAVAENSDIVIFDYVVTDGISMRNHIGCFNKDKKQLIRDLSPMRVSWSVCNKMFKRSLLGGDIIYPEGNMGEDMGLMMQLILKAEKISYESSPFYFYYQNSNSITQVVSEEAVLLKFQQHDKNLKIVLSAFKRNKLEEIYADSIVALKWNVRKGLWGLVHRPLYYKLWRETYPEIDGKLLFNSLITKQDKVKYLLTLLKLYPRKKFRI